MPIQPSPLGQFHDGTPLSCRPLWTCDLAVGAVNVCETLGGATSHPGSGTDQHRVSVAALVLCGLAGWTCVRRQPAPARPTMTRWPPRHNGDHRRRHHCGDAGHYLHPPVTVHDTILGRKRDTMVRLVGAVHGFL
jgi:hypothetical protein